MADSAPVGQYGIDVGITGGTDLAEPVYVSIAAGETHGQQPPDVGEDTDAPVVTVTLDALLEGTASFTIAVDETTKSLQCRLSSDGVAGTWEDCLAGAKSYTDLEPGSYELAVKAVDLADNSATYTRSFVVPEPVPQQAPITAGLALSNNATGNDVAVVNAPSSAAGARVRLFKVRVGGSLIRPAVAVRTAGAYGNARFVVRDVRKTKVQRYRAHVEPTSQTMDTWTPIRRLR